MPSYDLHGYLGKQQLSLLMAAFLLTLKEREKKKENKQMYQKELERKTSNSNIFSFILTPCNPANLSSRWKGLDW